MVSLSWQYDGLLSRDILEARVVWSLRGIQISKKRLCHLLYDVWLSIFHFLNTTHPRFCCVKPQCRQLACMWNMDFPLCRSSISFIFPAHFSFCLLFLVQMLSILIDFFRAFLSSEVLINSSRVKDFLGALSVRISFATWGKCGSSIPNDGLLQRHLQLTLVFCTYYMTDPCIMLEIGRYRISNLFFSGINVMKNVTYTLSFKGREIERSGIMA